jgi:integrase
MAKEKTCRANVGSRKEPKACGEPVAKGMLWACEQHKTTIPSGTNGVYYRGGKYVALTVHRGKQVKTFHDSFEDTRAEQRRRSGSIIEKPAGDRTPFDEYARAWIDGYQGRTTRGLDNDTRKAYRAALELYAIPHFGATPMREIGPKAYRDLITKMKRGHSTATVRKYCAPVKVLFAEAFADEDIPRNPTAGIPIGGDKNKAPGKPQPLETIEVAAVLNAIPEGRDRLLFRLLAHTGARISEILGLDWSDVDFEQHRLSIHRQWYRGRLKSLKTSNGYRTIDIDPEISAELKAVGYDSVGPMFTSNDRAAAR